MKKSVYINLGFIYSTAVFFSFVAYGGVANQYWFVLLLMPLYWFAAHKLDYEIEIRLNALHLALLCAAAFVLFNFENVSNSLAGDHLYHVALAYYIPIQLIKHKYYLIPDVKANFGLWLFSVGTFASTISMWILFKRSKFLYVVCLGLIGIVIASISMYIGLVNTDPHPPLRLYFLALTGLFGVSSPVFRLQGLMPLLLITYFILVSKEKRNDVVLLLVFMYTLPVLFFNSLIVEFSIWTFAVFTIFFMRSESNLAFNNQEIILYSVMFTLAGLIRQTAAFGLVLIVLECVCSRNFHILKSVAIISIPVLFQIGKSLLIGNPAAYIPDEIFLDIPANLAVIQRIWHSFSIDSYAQFVSTSGISGFLLIALGVGCSISAKKYNFLMKKIVFFALFWILFHSIRPILWGVPRYQLEYISPIVMMGFWALLRKFSEGLKIVLVFFIVVNFASILSAYRELPKFRIDYPEFFRGETPYFSELIFDSEFALVQTRENCSRGFSLGNSFIENVPLILAGLSMKDVGRAISAADVNGKNEQKKFCEISYVIGFDAQGFYNPIRNTTVIIRVPENQ